ncbi:MAG TPA: GDP-mannose 4,6-dehydratase [Roseiflexaceae bacterium]|nr:GDP-mannose 4,6-dehydratase [Roseiflexaceae bacterium]
MRALVTGINGFVGGYLAEHLLDAGGWDLVGTARQSELRLPHLRGQIAYHPADLQQRAAAEALLEQARPEVIFHLAGQANVPRSFEQPGETMVANTLPALHLFLAALRLGQEPLLLIVGSNEVYGQIRAEDLPVDEDTPLRPVNPYAVSKAAQDMLALQYHISHRLRTIRLRPFNHIGPRQTNQYVAAAFAEQIARIEAGLQPPMLRVGNLSAERDFTDVRDIVRAYAAAAQHGQPGAVYNIGSGRAVSIRWLLDTMVGMSSSAITVEPDPARMRPSDTPLVYADIERFRAETGWAPQIPLEHTLRDILDHWRNIVQTAAS